MSVQERIEMNPDIMLGKPIIRGTRVTVEIILRRIGEGATPQDIVEMYPNVTLDDIYAAVNYAADTLAHKKTVVHMSTGLL